MSRAFFVNGESMVAVKSNVASAIPVLTQLGLTDSPIRITPNFRHQDIIVDAWGPQVPPEIQAFLLDVNITISLVHFDPVVLAVCESLSIGGGAADGTTPRAGVLMGGNAARFAVGNNYIGLNILSPVAGVPWRFLYTYMTGPPLTFPLGTERSVVTTNWRGILYTNDPFGGGTAQPGTAAGTGALGAVIWDHILDT